MPKTVAEEKDQDSAESKSKVSSELHGFTYEKGDPDVEEELSCTDMKPAGTKMTFKRVAELTLNVKSEEMYNTDISEKLLSVKIARLDWQGFREIDNLDVLTSLEDLYLQHNRIEQIENLETLINLRFLALSNNRLTAVENISHLKSLRFLDVSHNFIENLDVTDLPRRLQALDCRGNPCCTKRNYTEDIVSSMKKLFLLDGIKISQIENMESEIETSSHSRVKSSVQEKIIGEDIEPQESKTSQNSSDMLERASARLDEICNNTSLRGKESFLRVRKQIRQRTQMRMAEQGMKFHNRARHTIENTSSFKK